MTRVFRMTRLPDAQSRVDRLVEAMDRFDLQPDYQRQSDVWGEEKRQLFIDSLMNGYDVPKLYFHRLPHGEDSHLFAIVDGKQRLETVQRFMRGDFALSEDFSDVDADGDVAAAAGKTFSALTRDHPALASRLSQAKLDIVVIETKDREIIEELFSRLNEAVPLNAPEKRNALRGAMPAIIRRIVARHRFFTHCLPFENKRYRQLDLAAKFLHLADQGQFVSTKKRDLDAFVLKFRDARGKPARIAQARDLARTVGTILDAMDSVFGEQDELLTSVGLVTVYFMAFLKATKVKQLRSRLTRERLLGFDRLRRENRHLQRIEQAALARGLKPSLPEPVRRDLSIFDRLMQSPNDGMALEYKYRVLLAFLNDKQFNDSLPKDLRHRIGLDEQP